MKKSVEHPFYPAISLVCQQHAWIVAAWVFGSSVKGTTNPESDIDIAILADSASSEHPVFPLITALEKATGRRVDLVLLNRAEDLLRYEVRKHGRLLFERDSEARKAFEVRSRKSFEDFLHIHRRYVAKVLYGGKCG